MTQSLDHCAAPLLAWYRQNARRLPWRETQDPYCIWVSEIMLQQTRVAFALSYYRRFMAHLPTVQALATVDEEQLNKLWQGLGYYSRARNLHKAAKQVAFEYSGVFPNTYEGLLALPGIGEYTAGAIASAAYGIRVPAVDGNVLRVMARLCNDDRPITDIKTKRQVREQVGRLMPHKPDDIRIFNQAVMELGATVCLPNGKPLCDRCPLADFCQSRVAGTAEQLPVRAPKKARRQENLTVFLLVRDGQIALRKRGKSGLLARLWEFPNLSGQLEEDAVSHVLADWGLTVTDWRAKLTASHIFTHVEWDMTGWVVTVEGEGRPDLVWADKETFETYAIPSAFSKFAAESQRILSDIKPTEKE